MRKFTNQFITLFIGLFLLLAIGIILYTSSLVKNATIESIEQNVQKRTENIAALMDEWLLQNASTVQTAVEDFSSLRFLLDEKDSIAFLTPEGTLVYSSNPYLSSAENQQNTREIRQILQGESLGTSGVVNNRNGNQEYRVAVPLFNGQGKIIGILRLSHELTIVEELNRSLQTSVFLFSFVSISLASILALYLAGRIKRPLVEIESVLRSLTEGNYQDSYRGADYPEVTQLGGTVNQLAKSLDEKSHALFHTNERLQALLNQLIVGVIVLQDDQQIELMNPAARSVLGIENEVTDHSFLEIARSAGLVEVIQRTYRQKKEQHAEIALYFPSERIVDVTTLWLPDEDGFQVIVLLYDLTNIRRLEKVRSDFVLNASHELRTPVTALKGFAETLLDGALDDPDRARQFVAIIQKEASRLEGLVADILTLSKVEQKQLPLLMEQVALQAVVEDCFFLIQAEAEKKNITLQLEAPSSPIYVSSERSRLEQIAANLVFNAVHYTDANGTVTVTLWEEEDTAWMSVMDNGIGIPEEDLQRVFERFYRIDKARSRRSGGTGLGLSIVRNSVEAMGGRITVESSLGLGTTFTVSLPKQ